jgi:hypothetical protein
MPLLRRQHQPNFSASHLQPLGRATNQTEKPGDHISGLFSHAITNIGPHAVEMTRKDVIFHRLLSRTAVARWIKDKGPIVRIDGHIG